jgi:biopolymer transport protein ExbD
MGMDLGGGSNKYGPRPAMNVTPLVDIVLVLLIIFMVITPMLNKQFALDIPKKDDEQQKEPPVPPSPDAPKPLVLTVAADGQAWINKDPVADAELADKLRRIFAARGDHKVFFDAADDVAYERAMQVMDLARGGDAVNIVVLTERVAN